ncbi:MAG: MarR family transcriptional regulator [Coriobacteriia bacterium]|nr:MarR family transcriptional regulator [Coriobacteriia bacterium]
MQQRTDVDASIVSSYRVIARALDRVMLPRLIELGLTMPQFKALIAVVTAGPGGISVTQLGCELSIGQPSASLIVDQLARPGYVERIQDTVDRRRVLVTATAMGAETINELRFGRHSTFAEWLGNVEQSDAEALERGLRSLSLAVQASAMGTAPVH